MKRVEKLNLLTSLLTGTATPKQLAVFRDSQKPIEVTFNLGDEGSVPHNPNQPTYHMEVYGDGTGKAYYRYPDGSIEYVKK